MSSYYFCSDNKHQIGFIAPPQKKGNWAFFEFGILSTLYSLLFYNEPNHSLLINK